MPWASSQKAGCLPDATRIKPRPSSAIRAGGWTPSSCRRPLTFSQQIVAEVACGEWGTGDLLPLPASLALPLPRTDCVVHFLSEGISSSSGRRVYLHDQVGRVRRGRVRESSPRRQRSHPDRLYRVVAEPEQTVVGPDEDFASESQAGGFLLGTRRGGFCTSVAMT
jgi:hypothetical protein